MLAKCSGVAEPGVYLLEYDDVPGEVGTERLELLAPRLQIPWHLRKLQGKFVGMPVMSEGLAVRWHLICNILHASVKIPMFTRTWCWMTESCDGGV